MMDQASAVTAPQSDGWLDTQAVARMFSLTPTYVKQMRLRGAGPKFHKISGSKFVRYRLSDVEAWAATWRQASSTAELEVQH